MARGRKSGCPVSVKDWLIYILDKAQVAETWVRIYGMDSISLKRGSSTEDGSADTDIWEEPFITKRNCKVTLKGKPIVNMSDGTPDEGQDMLDSYSEVAGCDGDCTLKFVDPYGHITIADYIVTDTSRDSGNDGDEISWDLEQVGMPESLQYYQMQSVTLKHDESGTPTTVTELNMEVGDPADIITIVFNPANASNKRFRVNVSGRKFVSVTNITEEGFSIVPVAAGYAKVTVTTLNGGKTASIDVNVSNPA